MKIIDFHFETDVFMNGKEIAKGPKATQQISCRAFVKIEIKNIRKELKHYRKEQDKKRRKRGRARLTKKKCLGRHVLIFQM